jgi:hypothetical protein
MISRPRVRAVLFILTLACTTEDAGINLGGSTGGQGGGGRTGTSSEGAQSGQQDAATDAPATGGRCSPGLKRGLGVACACDDECGSGFCADGVCCNTACTGSCVACNQPGSPGECAAVPAGVPDPHRTCAQQAPETCGYDGTCNGGGACARHAAGIVCKAPSCSGAGLTPASSCDGNGTCVAGSPLSCSPSTCAAGACKLVCTSDADCASPNHCLDGSCGLRGLGQSCSNTGQCKSGFCADGVCCDSACTGPCVSCGLPASLGRCVPVAAGVLDPRAAAAAGVRDPALSCADEGPASCGTNGRCDGAGACQRYADGSVCKDQTCDAGGNVWVAQSVCTGGRCVTPPERTCAPNRCSGTRCGGTCTVDGDCSPGNACVNGSCGKRPLGNLCVQDSDCGSNFCSSGVCCNSRCNGVCQACNVAGSVGACAPLPAGRQDPSGTCVDQGAAGCGNDGTCNGNGGCRKHRAGTKCADARCVNGMVTAASTCNGSGVCQAGATTSCGGIQCDPSRPQCLSGCSGDGQCVAPNICLGGKCGQSGPGGPCDENADCKQAPNAQFCVAGVCCNVSSCSGCRTCASGTCSNVAGGAAPVGGGCPINTANPICGNSGVCDGTGKCAVAAPGTACGRACSGDSRVPRTCPGNGGACAAGAPVSCGSFSCQGGVCLVAPCSTNADCAAGLVCARGACKTAPGGACASTGECGSGTCQGSPLRCCNCPAGGCADEGCDANGACHFHPAGSLCGPVTCNAANDATMVSTCDGAGHCSGAPVVEMCRPPTRDCVNGTCVKGRPGG